MDNWQGAEAKVAVIDYYDKKAVLKQRFRKTYRHATLDQKLLTRRITQEVRCLARAYKSGINCPVVYFVDSKEGTIIMEHISGHTAKEVIQNKLIPLSVVAEQVGKLVASAHATDLIHGDLTTSNILFRGTEAVLIDFGLSQVSSMTEDKAVDLYVLERAISSTHPESSELFSLILEAYADNLDISTGKSILNKLAEGVERGQWLDKGHQKLITNAINGALDELV